MSSRAAPIVSVMETFKRRRLMAADYSIRHGDVKRRRLMAPPCWRRHVGAAMTFCTGSQGDLAKQQTVPAGWDLYQDPKKFTNFCGARQVKVMNVIVLRDFGAPRSGFCLNGPVVICTRIPYFGHASSVYSKQLNMVRKTGGRGR